MLRFTASKLLNRSLALLKGAFLYITGFGGSVYSQTFKIRLLVLFYYLVLRIEIVCRYFALLISASISSFISSYVPSCLLYTSMQKGWLRLDWRYPVLRYLVQNRGLAHINRSLSLIHI